MDDALSSVLRLVAEGRLTADEAAPILDALSAPRDRPGRGGGGEGSAARGGASTAASYATPPETDPQERPRYARLEVRDKGRRVVDVRVPISLGRFALDRIPGLSAAQVADVQAAIDSNAHGAILDVADPDGDGVRIVLE